MAVPLGPATGGNAPAEPISEAGLTPKVTSPFRTGDGRPGARSRPDSPMPGAAVVRRRPPPAFPPGVPPGLSIAADTAGPPGDGVHHRLGVYAR